MSFACKDLLANLARFFTEANRPGIVSAYLFGSHAAGRSHRESDIDVGVLLDGRTYPTQRMRFEERIVLCSCLMAGLGTNAIDIVILNDAPLPMAANIVTKGRRVFCAQAALDRAFFRDVQLRAADLVPFLSRMRRLKLLALQK